MRSDKKKLAQLPATISKEQLRIVGHMSKRTATYLLDNQLKAMISDIEKNGI